MFTELAGLVVPVPREQPSPYLPLTVSPSFFSDFVGLRAYYLWQMLNRLVIWWQFFRSLNNRLIPVLLRWLATGVVVVAAGADVGVAVAVAAVVGSRLPMPRH